MSLQIFIQAFTTTFAMLCVIGPICMTVINTTIIHGFRVGIFAGLGVSCADAVYIIIASLDPNYIAHAIRRLQNYGVSEHTIIYVSTNKEQRRKALLYYLRDKN